MAIITSAMLACSQIICASETGIPTSTPDLFSGIGNAVNTGLLLLGGLAVVFLVYGGLQYILSAGNPARMKQARETILYAVVGVVVAGSAYGIISYITGQFK
jgi:hypothetical protein